MSVVMLHTPDEHTQLPLPLTWEVAPGVPAIPPAPRHLRLVGGSEVERVVIDETPSSGIDDAPELAWVARMARAVAEVGAGERPSGQLTHWVDRSQLAHLAARGAAMLKHPSARNRDQRGLTYAGAKVRAIRICPVARGIVETSAVIVGHARAQAVALRFEHLRDRWVVTAISLG